MKIPETPPAYCASCFGQHPDRRHVDFEAAWEGPVFENGIVGENGEIENKIRTSIDDLIICDECLSAAAALIGLKDPEELGEALEAVETQRDELLERVRGLEDYVAQLKATIAADPAPVAA